MSETRESLSRSLRPMTLVLLCFLPALVEAQTWTLQASPTQEMLHDIEFTDPHHGWAVGRGGVIIHTTDGGESWSEQSSNTSASLHAIDFIDPLNGWAVGLVEDEEGTILNTTDGGVHWIRQGNGRRTALFDIEFTNDETGIAVGGDGLIMTTTDLGTTWNTVHSGENLFFWDIECVNDSVWYITGQYNINPQRPPCIYATTDRGETWSVLGEDGTFGLQSASFTDESNGWGSGPFLPR